MQSGVPCTKGSSADQDPDQCTVLVSISADAVRNLGTAQEKSRALRDLDDRTTLAVVLVGGLEDLKFWQLVFATSRA